MAANYVLLDRIELNTTAASIVFDNIPQTGYTDLKLVSSIRAFDNNEWITLAINGATTNISGRYLYGNGASASSGTIAAGGLLNPMVPSSWTANTFSNNEFYITNYASTTTPKAISVDGVAEYNNASSDIMMSAVLWNSNAAITSVRVQTTAGTFAVGSTFSLYGIAKLGTTPAIAPKANGGNVIGTDGTYWYHAFLSSGTFTPQVGLTADILVVAGGGSGGFSRPGGGGAGGLLGFTSQTLANGTNYTCTVGAGAAGPPSGANGINGNDSQFAALTLVKGGGGGGSSDGTGPGFAGGSSGGSGETISTRTAPSVSGQGNAGGGYNGGGGGATQAGADGYGAGINGYTGKGGDGSSAYSSWGVATGTGQNVSGTYYFAGGGGGYARPAAGGAGGLGGGGAYQVSGTANTGGGAGCDNRSANGGSGIVIIRYLVA